MKLSFCILAVALCLANTVSAHVHHAPNLFKDWAPASELTASNTRVNFSFSIKNADADLQIKKIVEQASHTMLSAGSVHV